MYRLGLKQGGQTRTQVPRLDPAFVSWGCFLDLCSSVAFVERTDNRAVVCWKKKKKRGLSRWLRL